MRSASFLPRLHQARQQDALRLLADFILMEDNADSWYTDAEREKEGIRKM